MAFGSMGWMELMPQAIRSSKMGRKSPSLWNSKREVVSCGYFADALIPWEEVLAHDTWREHEALSVCDIVGQPQGFHARQAGCPLVKGCPKLPAFSNMRHTNSGLS